MWAKLVHYQYYENWRITWVWHHSRIMIWEWLAEVGYCNKRVRRCCAFSLTAGCWTLLNQGSGLRTHGSANPFVGLRSGLMLPIIVDGSYGILCLGRVRSTGCAKHREASKRTCIEWYYMHYDANVQLSILLLKWQRKLLKREFAIFSCIHELGVVLPHNIHNKLPKISQDRWNLLCQGFGQCWTAQCYAFVWCRWQSTGLSTDEREAVPCRLTLAKNNWCTIIMQSRWSIDIVWYHHRAVFYCLSRIGSKTAQQLMSPLGLWWHSRGLLWRMRKSSYSII